METLVALAILGIALGVVLQAFSGGLKSSRTAREYAQGIFHAREKMEELLLSEPLEPGTAEGSFGDAFRWRTEVTRVATPEEDAEILPFDTFQIRVMVLWGAEEKPRTCVLDTLRIGEKVKLES